MRSSHLHCHIALSPDDVPDIRHRYAALMKKKPSPQSTYRFTAVLEKSDNRLWGCHFRVPQHIAGHFPAHDSRRVIISLNGSAELQRALLPHGNGSFVLTVNKALRELLRVGPGNEVAVSLKRDTSEYGLPVPGEFRELLQQDPGGAKYFHALTPGRKRTLLYIIGSVKNPEKRAARAIAVLNHLRINKGSINFRQLNGSLKDPHR